jgi:hypothetical protein
MKRICLYWQKNIYVILLLSLSCFHGRALATLESNLKALSFFQQAEEAFDDHKIYEAKELVKQALSFKRHDGTVVERPKLHFKKSFVGRARKPVTTVQGKRVSYTPNKLLSLIHQKERHIFALTKNKLKRKSPPLLVIDQIIIDDEDGNGLISPYENILITFNVTNKGKTEAEDVVIHLSLFKDSSVSHKFKLGNLRANQKKRNSAYLAAR